MLLAIVGWLILLSPPVRANQIVLQMDIHQAGSVAGGNLSYYAFAFLNTTNTPITYDEVYSWNTNYTFQGGVGPGSSTYGLGFGSLSEMLNGFTNGPWKLVMNVGDASEQTYYFSMSALNFTSNTFPAIQVISPPNGAAIAGNNPAFTWTGTNNYSEVDVDEHDNTYSFYTSATLSPSTTNWTPGQALNERQYSFDVTCFNSNAPTVLIISTPTNSLGQTPPGWVTTNRLFAGDTAQFTVGVLDPLGTAHALVAHYPWDGTNSDGTASGADISGHGNDMNFGGGFGSSGGVLSTTTAAAGPRAIQFQDGNGNSGGFVGWNATPTNLLSALARSFSVSCWIKTTQNNFGWDQAPAYNGAGIVSADAGGLANDAVPLALTGNKIGFNTGGNSDDTVNSVTSVNDGTYHHVVVTRNQLTGQKIIYIDGVLDNWSSGSTMLLNAPKKMTIGALADAGNPDPNDGSYYNGLNGKVDDLQIYSGVLSLNEVALLFATPGTTIPDRLNFDQRLVARYDFEATNSAGTDSSGNGNDSDCTSGSGSPTPQNDTFSTNAAIGSFARLYFGDTSLCFSSGGGAFPNLSNALTASFTATAWVNTTNSVNSDFANAYFGLPILFLYNSTTNSTIPLSITGSKAAFTIYDENGNAVTLHSTTRVNDGRYHFLAVTRNQASGLMSLYVDGSLEATGTSSTQPLQIPWIHLAGGYYVQYQGLLDDVRIYSTDLTADDVAVLAGKGGLSGGPTFADALGTTGLVWTTSGATRWFVETTNTLDGLAVQSGTVTNNQTSTLQSTITGPGAVYFNWSTANTAPGGFAFDVEFDIDGSYQDSLFGDVSWTRAGPYYLLDNSPHTFSWTANANGSTDPRGAAFLDQITFSNVHPAYVQDVTLNGSSIGLGYHVLNLLVGTNATIVNQVFANPPATNSWYKNSQLLPAQTSASFSFTNLQLSDSGYYVFQTHNQLGGLTEEDFVINAYLPTDLQPLSFSYPSVVSSASLVSFTWAVTNTGPGAVSNVVDYINFSAPAGAPYFQQSTAVFNTEHQNTPGGATYTVSNYFRFPNVGAGTYTLILDVNANNAVIETATNNNTLAGPQITVVNPDLQPGNLHIATTTNLGGTSITLTYNTTNNGPGIIDLGSANGYNWYDVAYLSTSPVLDSNAVYVAQINQRTNLGVGGYFTTAYNVTLPNSSSGDYYLIVAVDSYGFQGIGNIWESSESNNVVSIPIHLLEPDLVVANIAAAASASSLQSLHVDFVTQNQGDAAAANPLFGLYNYQWYDQVYISTHDVLDNSAIGIGALQITNALSAGQTATNSLNVTVPGVAQGNYYLLVQADSQNLIAEHNKANNVLAVPLQILNPDLAPLAVKIPPEIIAKATVQVSWGVTNYGAGSADGSTIPWYDALYISTNANLNPNQATLLGIFIQTNFVAGGGSYSATNTVTLPNLPSGTYYWNLSVNSPGTIYESTRTNNNLSLQFPINNPPQPFIAVKGVTGPPQNVSGQPMQITWSLTNQGAADFNGTLHDYVYLSPNSGGSNGTFYATFNFSGTIPVGKSVALSGFITPDLNLSGNQWIVVQTDANAGMLGGDGLNYIGIATNPVAILLAPLPALQVSHVNVPPSAFGGQPITITWAVTNAGNAATSTTLWKDAVWLSGDGLIDIAATFLGATANPRYLNPADSYVNSFTVTLPPQIQGTYYFVVQTDYEQRVLERQRTNDRLAGGPTLIQVPPLPELEVSVTAPPAAFSGQNLGISWRVINGGAGATSQNLWYDAVYLSTNNVFDSHALLLGFSTHLGVLASGDAYSISNFQVTLPVGISGNYYFLVAADNYQMVYQVSRQYSIAASSPATQVLLTPPPDLAVQQVSAPGAILSAHSFLVTNVVANVGASATPNSSWADYYYLSPTTNLDFSTALFVGSIGRSPDLQAGQAYTNVLSLTVPNGLAGIYYLFVIADALNQVFELNKTNNIGSAPSPLLATAPLTDLVVTGLNAPATVLPGTGISVSWTVRNRGATDTVVAAWFDNVFLSADAGGSSPINLGYFYHFGSLNPGDSYTVTNQFMAVPYGLSLGAYYLFVVADTGHLVYLGSNSVDRTSAPRAITLSSPTADLSVGWLTAPTNVAGGSLLSIGWAVTNLGPGQTYASYWNDSVYLSTNSIAYLATNNLPLAQDVLLGAPQHVNNLSPGAFYANVLNIAAPDAISGDFTAYVLADSGHRVAEDTIRSNNVFFATNALHIQFAPPVLLPDLAVTQVTAPTQALSSQTFPVTYTVKNVGPGLANGGWYDSIYLSPDPFLDPITAFYLGSVYRAGTLTNGQQYTNTASFPIPAGLYGFVYVFVASDLGNSLLETVVGDNNVAYAPDAMLVTIPAPADLVVTSVQTPTNAMVNQVTTVYYTVSNQGTNAAQGNWTDGVYLSTDGQWSPNDPLLGYVQQNGYIAAGSNYTGQLGVSLPGVTAGNYYVIIRPDVQDSLNENLAANHNGSTSNTFSIDVPQLTLGLPQNSLLLQSQQKFFKVFVPAGQTLSVALNSDSPFSANELYVRYGTMPDQANFDYLGNNPSSPGQQITVPSTRAGWYYIMLLGDAVSGISETCTLEATLLSFSVSAVAPDHGGNAGKVTAHLQGAKITAQATARLVGSSGATITGATRSVPDSTQMYVTFDLQGAATGLYSVQLLNPGSAPVTLSNAFTITKGLGAKLAAGVKIPGAVRPGFFYTATLNYENSGDEDMPAPFFVVTNSLGAPMSLTSDGTLAPGMIKLLGIAQDGPAGVLRPGVQYSLPMYFQVPADAGAHERFNFDLKHLIPSAAPVDWSMFLPSQTGGLPADAWAAISANIELQAGPHMSDFLQSLANDATFYSQGNQRVHDVARLFNLEILKAMNIVTPVHTLESAVDDSPPGHNLYLSFGRAMPTSINHRFQIGPFGRGWVHTFEYSLFHPSTNIVDITPPNGSDRVFVQQPNQTWKALPGDNGVLQAAGGGAFTITELDGSISRYDSQGHLVSVQDSDGNHMTFAYSGANLTGITHSDGRQMTLAYNGFGRISSLSDSGGQSTQYYYDASGEHLLSVVSPGNVTNSYAYVPATGTSSDHALQTITYPSGTHRYFVYDALGRLLSSSLDNQSQQISYGYDSTGDIFETNALHAVTTLLCGERGQVLQRTDALGHILALNYDDNFNVTQIMQPAGQTTLLGYDTLARRHSTQNALGQQVSLDYTNLSRLSAIHNQRGRITRFNYDGRGNLTQAVYPDLTSESAVYDGSGSVTNFSNRRGQTIQYVRNAIGQIVKKSLPDGRVITYAYDVRGYQTNITDSVQGVTTIGYDARGFMTNIFTPDSRRFAFTYDNAGHRTQRAGSDGYVLNYHYDVAGRLLSVNDGANQQLVQYAYDAAGQLTNETKGNGTVTRYTYDAAEKLIGLTNYAPDSSVQSFFNYGYDANGNCTSMTNNLGVTSYQYDALGELVGAAYPGGRQVTYVYDAAGNRTTMTDTGTNTDYSVNAVNEYTQAGAAILQYDADGNLTNRTDAGGTTTYQYDAENNLFSVSTPTNGVWQYAYDALGRRTATTHNGVTTHYQLDPTFADVAAEYDDGGALIARYNEGLGLLSRIDGSGNQNYYSFDALGNTRALTGTNGTVLNTYDYDAFGAATLANETVSNEFRFVGRFGVTVEPMQLYFMKNRFYAPDLGRFQSEDPIGFRGGLNLAEYANNNPVSESDPIGLRDTTGFYESRARAEAESRSDPTLGIRTVDFTGSATAGGGAVGGFTISANGVQVYAGGSTGEGVGGGVLFSKSTPTEGLNVAVTVSGPGGAIQYGFSGADADKQAKTFIQNLASSTYNGSSIEVGPYIGTPGITVSYYYVSPPLNNFVGYAIDYWGDTLVSLTPKLMNLNLFFEDDDDEESEVLVPGDPNQKTGPVGYGPNGLISARQPIPYTITFVNASNNTAPAHVITISDQLDPSLDPRTFRLTEIVFGTNTVQVPPNRSFIQTNLTVGTADGPVLASVIAGVNIQSGTLFWNLTAIDPATGQSPADPILGLLPPDNTNHIGEGRVSYTVTPYAGLSTGTSVTNAATITFDNNPPIVTPAVVNTLDAGTPDSHVTLGTNSPLSHTFMVSWSGSDNNGASGLASYNIFVSDNGGPFQLWLGNTTLTSAPYVGQPGHTYTFYSIALDNAGNSQSPPAQPNTSIFVSTNLPPAIAPITNVVVVPDGRVFVKISATDPNGDQLSYSLAAGAPAGASIGTDIQDLGYLLFATNVVFAWTPSRGYAETTNAITVTVTDNGVPPLTTGQTFLVTVLDYLELSLGSTNLEAGHTAGVPLYLASNAGVTNLGFVVQHLPPNLLTNWSLAGLAPQIANATLQDYGTNVVIELHTQPGQSLNGTQQISQLNFLARTNQLSSFITLAVSDINGVKPNSGTYANYIAHPGRVAVVVDQPLLDLNNAVNPGLSLLLYGKPGTNYQLQFTTNIAAHAIWLPLLNYAQTNGVIDINVNATNPAMFYRLKQQ